MNRCRIKLVQALWGLVFFGCTVHTAGAASLALVPVRLTLSSKQPIGAITVRNDGADATVVQLEVAAWSQAEGKDVYAPTAEILATPPIFTIPPGGSQLVRVGLRRPADADRELTYRVFMQEVPPPPTGDFKGLRVALRFGVPIFVAASKPLAKGATAPVASLQWQAHLASGTGRITLTATNTGSAHVQVTRFTLMPPGDPAPPIEYKSPEYVFPGQRHDWPLELKPVPVAGTTLHLSAGTDAGPVESDVVVQVP